MGGDDTVTACGGRGAEPHAEHGGGPTEERRRWLLRAASGAGLAVAGGWLGVPAAAAAAVWRPPPLLQAQVDRPHVDPRHYLVSEKFDGVRAYWDGRQLQFRSGRPVPAPVWFVDALPSQALDGELWLGRRRFDELSGLVRRDAPDDDAWRAVRYLLFELPDAPGPFSDRAKRLATIARDRAGGALQAVPQQRVGDRAALERLLAATVAAGGEGLMLHRADAPYVTGRSEVLIKVKPALDAEAVVVAHWPGRGRHRGVMGALELRMPEGGRFRVGTGFSDAQRRAPPPVGATVTYRYRELTPSGLPRFASFVRVREEP